MSIWPYEIYGDPKNPPVLFLHGFLGRGMDWQRVAKVLARGYFCIMPDLPGHGKNIFHPRPEEMNTRLSFKRLNKDLCTLLDSLSLRQTHLVGYSMGGRAALYFAIHYPESVLSLALESASPGIKNSDERRARRREDDWRAEMILSGGIEHFVDHWYTLPLFHSLHSYPDVRMQTIAQRKVNQAISVAKVIRDLSPGRQPVVWDHLPSLEMPVLLISGGLDEKYVALGRQMNAHIPRSLWKIIPASGHTSHLEQPEFFSSLLWEFLDEVGTMHNDP